MSSNKMYASPTFNVLRDSYDNSAADNFKSAGATNALLQSANGSSGFKEMLSAASASPGQEDGSKIVNSRFFGNLVRGSTVN